MQLKNEHLILPSGYWLVVYIRCPVKHLLDGLVTIIFHFVEIFLVFSLLMSELNRLIWHLSPLKRSAIDLEAFWGLYQFIPHPALQGWKCISGPREFVASAIIF